jgi:ribosome-binding protein aMBF1 (putative translation factor)
MTHGTLIRLAREKQGWSRSRLSREAKVDRGMLIRIEDGELDGSVETLRKLAKALPDMNLNLLREDGGFENEPCVDKTDEPLTVPDFTVPDLDPPTVA